ncbi:PD-(D/E)XK nuclease family protein [Mannheimia haemolytica]|uniref:PD-(D/E)XK nuclease family protein n=1 Tax=Mannheimia haemolytica TaxID=75985 RepID=UPI003AFA0A63
MNNQDIQQSLTLLRELYKKDQEWLAEQKKSEIYNANRFNPFRFLRKDELGLSAILAFFLNPKETHGQGDVFLNSFLKKLNLYHFLAYDDVEITVEKSTGTKRRHDIFIQGKLKGRLQWVLSIENKLNWAGEQKDQLKDYLSDLKSYGVGNNYFLMFLPVESYDPISVKPEDWQQEVKNGNAIVWDANLIMDWLNDVIIIAPEIQSFTKFFIQYLKEVVMGENKNSSNLANAIINDPRTIKMSIDILNSKTDILSLLIQKLMNDIKEKFSSLERSLEWEFNLNLDGIEKKEFCPMYIIRKDKWNEFTIYIEFEYANFKNLHFGICYEFDPNQTKNKEINAKLALYEKLFSNLPEEFRKERTPNDGWCAYWQYFNDNLKNWDGETWAKIPSGQLADEIWEEIKPLCIAVTQLEYSH